MQSKILSKSLLWSLTLSTFSLPLHAINIFEKADVKGQLSFGGDYVDNKQVEARVFGITGYLDVESPLTDSLKIKIAAGATLEVGSNNSFIIDEYAPRRQWRLKNAYLGFDPFSFLSFKAGAVSQKEYRSPLLVTGSAFLALQEKISLNFSENHSIYLKAQQAIPNNLNLTQRIGIVEDGTPSFLMETVGIDFKGDILSLWAEGSRWGFNSLSTGAAYQSQFLGNSVSGGSQLNSDFLYSFSGLNFAAGMKVFFADNWGVSAEGQYLYNDKAPEERNKGTLIKFGLILDHIQPSINIFRVESDASVGFYNSQAFSHNNHEGYSLALSYEDPYKPDENAKARIAYVDSSPIKYNAFQSDTKKVLLSLDFPFNF